MTLKNILITSALPYVNNVPHLGNIIGCVLPADVYNRFCKLLNYNTLFICGTDSYGTATEIRAKLERVSPVELCLKYHKIHEDIYEWFNIEFDYFGKTNTELHTKIVHDIFNKLEKNNKIYEKEITHLYCNECELFLADRYVEGECSNCSKSNTYGDQCDNCNKYINNAMELINPTCKICNTSPIIKKSKHLFLTIDDTIKKIIKSAEEKEEWTSIAISQTKSLLIDEIKDMQITRDLQWGTPVPKNGYENKVFYGWFDAPIGYISITANLTKKWKTWWQNPNNTELIQFMGKDNIRFHSINFPATLLGTNDSYTLVTNINATHYLTYENKKFSKSQNVGIFGDVVKNYDIPADIWRYYLLYIRPETSDTTFSWFDFKLKIDELTCNIGNFIYRILNFTYEKYGGQIPNYVLEEKHVDQIIQFSKKIEEYVRELKSINIRSAIRIILTISKNGNRYFHENKTWKLYDNDRKECDSIIGICCNIVKVIAIMLYPYMPIFSKEIFKQLNIDENELSLIKIIETPITLPVNHIINKPTKIFKKINIPK